jgi:hypothetical protein
MSWGSETQNPMAVVGGGVLVAVPPRGRRTIVPRRRRARRFERATDGTSCRGGFVASAPPGTESLSVAGVGLAAGKRRPGCGVRSPIRTKVPSELAATWSMPTGVFLSVVLALEDVVPVVRKLFAAMLAVLVARAASVLNDFRRRNPERGGPSSGSTCSSGSAHRRPESSTAHSRCGSSCMKQTVRWCSGGAV